MIKMNREKVRVVVLLTGCVVPNTTDYLVIADIESRKAQYLKAIRWYLSNTDFRIVFGENSGTDLSDYISEVWRDRVEFITYKSEPVVPDRGKGYKEMEILEYCYVNSFFLKDCEVIVKGTGRLILKNIVSLVNCLKGHKHFISSWMRFKYRASDSRFFFCSSDFMEYFIREFKNRTDRENIFEVNLAKAIRENNNYTYLYPLYAANIDGIGGGWCDLQYICHDV